MSPETFAIHEQMLRHFSGVLGAIDKLLKDIAAQLKELKAEQSKRA